MVVLRAIPRGSFSLILAALIIAASISFNTLYSARGDSHDTTFYACLFAGSLSQVNTTRTPENCGRGTPISWNVIGPQGEQGPQGIQGEQGLQGVQGEQGLQGIQGEQGLQGVQGEQGMQGVQGEQGLQGIQGEPGTDGVSGYHQEVINHGEQTFPINVSRVFDTSCPSGKVVLSGGVTHGLAQGSQGLPVISFSRPANSTTWRIGMTAITGEATVSFFNTYAVCADMTQ